MEEKSPNQLMSSDLMKKNKIWLPFVAESDALIKNDQNSKWSK